ncbi:MAG: DUF6499 domain-containing protein [Pseudomonadota bacterium]|jgi:hypothetical protein|uniref:transcriptional regulator domain-containing protein n=1 Tax=unclassified Sphingomonas TaxID=196159 RepID=UPI00053D2727|nr:MULTISPECIES: DUF6499 domain-containing protein [unclassified Sphingomonas]
MFPLDPRIQAVPPTSKGLAMTGERRGNGATRRNLDFAGFAQEFLRRNPAYRKDYQAISRNNARGMPTAEQEVMARRWGLCFSMRTGCASGQ